LEKSKKYLHEKFNKKENDYRYYQLKEEYENKEKKLIDKVNMQKKSL
jgi:steroid 5-alpha reductase family enzyme